MRRGGEPGHVDTDLADDRPRGVLADAGDAGQPLACLGERGGRLPDAGVEPGNHRVEVVDVVRCSWHNTP